MLLSKTVSKIRHPFINLFERIRFVAKAHRRLTSWWQSRSRFDQRKPGEEPKCHAPITVFEAFSTEPTRRVQSFFYAWTFDNDAPGSGLDDVNV